MIQLGGIFGKQGAAYQYVDDTCSNQMRHDWRRKVFYPRYSSKIFEKTPQVEKGRLNPELRELVECQDIFHTFVRVLQIPIEL